MAGTGATRHRALRDHNGRQSTALPRVESLDHEAPTVLKCSFYSGGGMTG